MLGRQFARKLAHEIKKPTFSRLFNFHLTSSLKEKYQKTKREKKEFQNYLFTLIDRLKI